MLQRNIDYRHASLRPASHFASRPSHVAGTDTDALLDIVRCLRRNTKFILSIAVIGTIVAIAAVFSITPKYMATVTLLIDPRTTKILQEAEVVGRPGTDNGAIESEVELLQSDASMRRVAEKLSLRNDAEFSSGGLIANVKALVLLPIRILFGKDANDDTLSAVVDRLNKNVDAKRRGLTYVIELNAWSQDAKKSARIANAFAESYLADQLAVKSEATSRASKWLNERVDEMRARVSASEKALEQYKSEANLFDSNGQNLSNRQVAQLNDQLVDARAKAAAARAKFDQLKQVTPEKLRSAAASPDVLQSGVVSNLRGQYADIAKQQAERETRYGPQHPLVTSGRAQLVDVERQITAEINRIVTSAKIEHEMAKSREESIDASLDELKSKAGQFNQAAIRLNEFEREAQANRDLFQSFLVRAKQTSEMSMQVADSRIVSGASVPTGTSYPKKSLMIGLGFFGSLGLAAALALGRDAFGKGFRHSIDVEQALGLQPLASIPRVGDKSLPKRDTTLLRLDPPNRNNNVHAASARLRNSAHKLAGYSVTHPDSAFAESIRTLYLTLRQQAPGRHSGVILVTSALQGEGKSTVAANLGRTAAMAGDNVLLIDADLRRPSLASALDIGGDHGLADVLTGRCAIDTSVKRDPRSGLYVIAGTQHASGVDALGLLSSHQMTKLMTHARDIFDLVVVDASPLLPVADSRILMEQADSAILVVASERTSRQAVAAAIRECPDLETKMAGVVLNGTVDDFDRYYVNDRTVIPTGSMN